MGNAIELTAGYATTGQGAGPMLVTEQAGLFRAHGLEVTTRMMGSAKAVVAGLMAGEIAFGNLAAPALLKAVLLEGADAVFVTGGINQQFLVGRPGIGSRQQLAGGSIGLLGDGGLNDLFVHFIKDQLEHEGVGAVAALALSSKQKIAALRSRECDALVMSPPEAVEARRQGCSFLVDFGEYGLNFALGGIATRRATIEGKPEMVAAFVEAYVSGMQLYKTDRAFTIGVQQTYSQLADRGIAEETYDLTAPGMPTLPAPRRAAFKVALELLSREVPEAAGADPARFIDDRFITSAKKRPPSGGGL